MSFLETEAFKAFAFYGSLLVGKVLIMAFLTARQRMANNVSQITQTSIWTL